MTNGFSKYNIMDPDKSTVCRAMWMTWVLR